MSTSPFADALSGQIGYEFGASQQYIAIAVFYDSETLPPLAAGTLLLFAAMATLGMGNGAVFQLVPQRFPREIGVTTGIVGSAGGLGGFVLPTALGTLKQATGSFGGGFLALAILGGFGGALALAYASRGWRGRFISAEGRAAEAPVAPRPFLAEAGNLA